MSTNTELIAKARVYAERPFTNTEATHHIDVLTTALEAAEAELTRLSELDGATEPGEPNAWPSTPGEFAARWNARTLDQRAERMQAIEDDVSRSMACRIEDHHAEITGLRTELTRRDVQIRGLRERQTELVRLVAAATPVPVHPSLAAAPAQFSIDPDLITRVEQRKSEVLSMGHHFIGVDGHPDDDECTFREDGTDRTYCGRTEGEHYPAPNDSNILAVAPVSLEAAKAEATKRVLDDAAIRVRELPYFRDADTAAMPSGTGVDRTAAIEAVLADAPLNRTHEHIWEDCSCADPMCERRICIWCEAITPETEGDNRG